MHIDSAHRKTFGGATVNAGKRRSYQLLRHPHRIGRFVRAAPLLDAWQAAADV